MHPLGRDLDPDEHDRGYDEDLAKKEELRSGMWASARISINCASFSPNLRLGTEIR